MRFKGTFVLFLVCLALGIFLLLAVFGVLGKGVYSYFFENTEQHQKAKEAENQVWKLDDKNIQEIDLAYSSQHITAIKKNDMEWVLTAPQQWEGDSEELSRLAISASILRREKALDQENTDLSKFGLSPAQSSLKLKTKDGKEYAVDFGNSNPSGDCVYARLSNQKAVFLVAGYTASSFNKKVEDLRNHSVLRFEQPEAQTLNIKSPKGKLELIKDANDNWWLAGTEKRAADSPEVRKILNALSMAKIKEFFNDNLGDYINTGLDKPFIDVNLTYGKDKAIKHFIIGSEKSKLKKKGKQESKAPNQLPSPEMYLAKDESRTDLFFVEKDFVDKLLKSPNDVRDKALASFQRWEIDSIMLANSKGNFNFTKSGGEWFLGDAKKKAKAEAVNEILDSMEKPIKEWIDKPAPLSTYNLDKPFIHVVLKKGDNVIIDCSLGNAAKNGGIYSQIKGDSSVKVADPEGIGILDQAEPDFVEVPAAAPAKK
jgi:hypothetical protein